MRLTAIVPTHDRPRALQKCLEALGVQTIDRSRFEVIVIDDGSPSDIAALVAGIAAGERIPMRCERQPMTGLNSARNRGLALASGDVVAFLDDDTVALPGWAGALLSAFEAHQCAAVGGRIELVLDRPMPDWLAPRSYYLGEYDLGPRARRIGAEDPVPVGANCAVHRSAFDRVGGFRPGLDRIATSLVSNGDTEFFRRLQASGATLWYEPEASVAHCIPPERVTQQYFVKRHHAQGVSDELLVTLQGRAPTLRRRADLAFELLVAFRHAGKMLGKDLLAGRGTIGARFEVSYLAGRLMGAGLVLPAGGLDPDRSDPGGRAPAPPPPV